MRFRKSLASILIIFAFIITWIPAMSIPALAETSGTCGDNLTWSYDDGVLTISGNGPMDNYGHFDRVAPWTDLSDNIKNAIIKKGVTSVGEEAFSGCSSLMSVTIPNSITSIGDNAFISCNSLVSVTLPNSVTDVGLGAFRKCISLAKVALPMHLISVKDGTFTECSSLTSITIPNGVSYIGRFAFQDCSNLNSVTIPDSVTCIDYWAFEGCSSLTSVVIPDGVTAIEECTFEGCSNLKRVTIPNSVTSIGERAFLGCKSLTSVDIPDNVTSVGEDAFYGCSSLTSVVIPDGVTEIEDSTFMGCSSLKSVTVPNTVTSIGKCVFAGCISLTNAVIPVGLKSIGEGAFCDCKSLTSVVLPNSVTFIGDYAFKGCSGLTSIVLPEGITSIGGECAFYGCSSLVSITIPSGVTAIDYHAFDGCSSLTSVVIPASVKTIGESAFVNCESLTSIVIPSGVTSIAYRAFEGCSRLTSAIVPDGVTEIEDYAFSSCSSLASITIPSSVTSIGDDAFQYCSSLTSITIPNSVTSLGRRAFAGCSSLASIVVPKSIKNVEPGTFMECSSLVNITLSEGITNIGNGAFKDCSSIENIVIPNSVRTIEPYAFLYCSSLKNVIIPQGVESISGEILDNLYDRNVYYSGNKEQWNEACPSGLSERTSVQYNSYGPTNWNQEKTERKQVRKDIVLCFSKDITYEHTGTITTLLAEIEADNKKSIEDYIKNTLRFTKDELRVHTPGEDYGDCILNRDDCIVRYQENEGKTIAQIYAVCDVNIDSSHNYEFWEEEWIGHVMVYGPQSIKDDSLDYYNYVSREDIDPSLRKLEQATAEVFSEYENFLNTVQSIAQEEGQKALPPVDLSKKLESAGAIFTDTGVPKELYTYVYQTVADNLVEIASAKMTEVSYNSDQTKYATKLVNAVASDYLYINKTEKFKNNKIQVDANIHGIYGAYYGEVKLTDKTASPTREYSIAITMNNKHINDVIANYVQSLDNLAESATDAVYFAMANDLLGKTIGNFTADKITEFAANHSQILTKLKLNGFKEFCLEIYDLYQSIPRYQSTMKTADTASLIKNLDTYLTSTNSYLSEIKNSPAKKAGNKVEKKLKDLLTLWRKYEKGEDITKESFWKTIFGCPVKVTVYDANGTEIGYSGTDDMWYDDTIEIVEEGDAKIIYSPIGKELNFKVEAYDYGNLSCSVEEVENGAASGRKNYYLSLTEDTEVNLKLPDNSIFSGNGEIEVKANDQEIGLEKTLTSDYYQPFRIVLKTEDVNAGIVYGAGDYIEGDAVHIMAMPQEGYIFNGWYENGDLVSMEDNLEFTAVKGINYTARFLNLDELRPSKQENVLIGDVDGNGGVDAKDITALARHLAKIEIISDEKLLNNADTTQNGNISAEDLTQLAKYVAKIIPSL